MPSSPTTRSQRWSWIRSPLGHPPRQPVADVPDGKLQQSSSTKTSSRAKFNLPNPNLFYIASQIAAMEPDLVAAGASSSPPPSPVSATSPPWQMRVEQVELIKSFRIRVCQGACHKR
ncbi:40S ribosomal protein S7-2 [Zea mays]|uniref:40S ribosomal protein S7-2 n=1 Tax=Zea mays TaxID=4577 RepID=A0A1D6E3X1_MAIZE|nr:40S ribosomal protein S7-2 [Zea mays]ONM15224.1 40S ribosomal protein S7-2 [Zea mays]